MKISISIITICALVSALLISSCKKYEEAKPLRNFPGDPVTDSLLMQMRLVWEVIDVERKYISPSGSIDSTISPDIYVGYQQINFGVNTGNGQKVYAILDDNNPANLIIPQTGNWNLSNGGTKMTFTESISFPGGGPGGTFDVGYFPVGGLSSYSYIIDIKIKRALPGGRTLAELITIGGR